MPSKQYLAAAHPTGGHVTRLDPRASPPWTTCSPISAVVDQQVQTYFDKVAGGVVNSVIALAAARGIQKATGGGGSDMSSEEAGQSRSCNAWAS